MIRKVYLSFFTLLILINPLFSALSITNELQQAYDQCCQKPGEINEHLPSLRKLAQECSSVAELGLNNMNSSLGIILGLSENASRARNYIGVDCKDPNQERFRFIERVAAENQIVFQFFKVDDVFFYLPEVDLLFIDTLHNYLHLTYELEKFSPQAQKYIVMHDTSPPFGYQDQIPGLKDPKYLPWKYNPQKKGLWAAVEDFLARHSEWVLLERKLNNHGLTILKRAKPIQ